MSWNLFCAFVMIFLPGIVLMIYGFLTAENDPYDKEEDEEQ